jgi:hypothetical protein
MQGGARPGSSLQFDVGSVSGQDPPNLACRLLGVVAVNQVAAVIAVQVVKPSLVRPHIEVQRQDTSKLLMQLKDEAAQIDQQLRGQPLK